MAPLRSIPASTYMLFALYPVGLRHLGSNLFTDEPQDIRKGWLVGLEVRNRFKLQQFTHAPLTHMNAAPATALQ